MISPSSTNPKVTETGDYIFRVCFIDPFQGTAAGQVRPAHAQGARRSRSSRTWRRPTALVWRKFFREAFVAGGGEIVSEQKYTGGDKDFKAQLTAIKSAQPDAIMVPGYYTDAGLIVRAGAAARHQGAAVRRRRLGGARAARRSPAPRRWRAPTTPRISRPRAPIRWRRSSSRPTRPATTARCPMPWRRWATTRPWCWPMPSSAPAPPTARSCAMRSPPPRISPAPPALTTLDAKRDASKPAVIITVKDGKFEYVETIAP